MTAVLPRRLAFAIVVAAGALVGAWAGGLIWFAADLAARVEDAETATDAVVVLTGGAARLEVGLSLLESGKGRKLFVSGVHKGVDLPELLRKAHASGERARCCVVLGHAADDTIGNAAETAQWMRHEGYASLRLVTANYHMRRAMLEFRRAMPDAAIVAHPVFPVAFKRDEWWRWPGTFHLLAVEYTKYLGALARPIVAPKKIERNP